MTVNNGLGVEDRQEKTHSKTRLLFLHPTGPSPAWKCPPSSKI